MTDKQKQFVSQVWRHYCSKGRHELSWRNKSHLTPYCILVSEMMLQQTQVSRVVPKYRAFVKRWPNAKRFSTASLGDVLTAWQGLGYNRRAKALHEACRYVAVNRASRFPKSYEGLLQLPGVGPYTAGAIMAFAYNRPVPIIETNIRTVYLHHFFNKQSNVSDVDILSLVEATLDQERPREWYWALMDYGAFLKQQGITLNHKSRSYKKQTAFAGSDREIRGAIVRTLTKTKSLTVHELVAHLPFAAKRIEAQIGKLQKDGLVLKTKERYHLP